MSYADGYDGYGDEGGWGDGYDGYSEQDDYQAYFDHEHSGLDVPEHDDVNE